MGQVSNDYKPYQYYNQNRANFDASIGGSGSTGSTGSVSIGSAGAVKVADMSKSAIQERGLKHLGILCSSDEKALAMKAAIQDRAWDIMERIIYKIDQAASTRRPDKAKEIIDQYDPSGSGWISQEFSAFGDRFVAAIRYSTYRNDDGVLSYRFCQMTVQ